MRETSNGQKKLLSVYINKNIITQVEEEASKNRRTKSGQVEELLSVALKEMEQK